MKIDKIITIVHGSHLYGTNTPSSDLDIKGVYIPNAKDILLQKIKKSINSNTKSPDPLGITPKNSINDVDTEYYSLDKYISLFQEGQTVALEIMFATPLQKPGIDYTAEWLYLWNNHEHLISKKADAFLGYAYKQASKYGIKGSRVAAIKNICEVLESIIANGKGGDKLSQHHIFIETFIKEIEFSSIDIINNNGKEISHLNVCGRKAPYTITVNEAHKIYKKILEEYGQRALQAEKQEGVDWKALSHAVRVGTQSIEYLETGFVTFPRPDKQHLLDIKQGKLYYQNVAEEIESLLERVKEAAENSKLPIEPDYEWCEKCLLEVYRKKILETC